MAVGTVAEIKTAAADWLNRSDLTSQIDDFYSLALIEATRKLETKIGTVVTEKTISASEATAKRFFEPSDSLDIISITDSKGNPLTEVTYEEYRAYTDTSGSPMVYARAESYIYIAPPPAENDVFTIQSKALNSSAYASYQSSGSSFISDILLYGILMHAYVFLKDDNRVALFKQKFDELILDVNRNTRFRGRIKDESIAQYGGPLA